jgi:hypothetical protein
MGIIVNTMFIVKNPDGTKIKVEEPMLFTMFLKNANQNDALLEEVFNLEPYFSSLLDEEALLKSPLIKLMNIYFILGYQYSQFRTKNDAEFIQSNSDTTDTDPEGN